MKPNRIMIVGTMAFVITVGAVIGNKESQSNRKPTASPAASHSVSIASKDPFLQVLGADSDEEIYEALYDGKSLADIAVDHNRDVQPVIDLQIAQLTEQLDLRLAEGSITPEQYNSHKSELADIITGSVFGHKTDSKHT